MFHLDSMCIWFLRPIALTHGSLGDVVIDNRLLDSCRIFVVLVAQILTEDRILIILLLSMFTGFHGRGLLLLRDFAWFVGS